MTRQQFERLSNKFEVIFTAAIGGGVLGLLLLSAFSPHTTGIIGGVAGSVVGIFIGFRNKNIIS
jgi:hypothetical protein